MSMSVPYVPPDYVPPSVETERWSGPERRSTDPVNRLGRSLNRLCLEAADPYEIVAHLEALGYNTPSALARLGAEDHFKVAESLYARTPRVYARQRPPVRRERSLAAPVAMVLALIVTFGLGAYATASALVAATWVLIWSQATAALLSWAEGDSGRAALRGVLAVLTRVGLLGLGLVWSAIGFGLDAGAPALLWLGVAGLLWSRRYATAIVLPLLSGAVIAVTRGWGEPPTAAQAVTIAIVLVATVPVWTADGAEAVGWLRKHARRAFVPALYGLGQGLLIVSLLRSSPADADHLPGVVLLAAILALSQALLLALKGSLSAVLWHQSDVAAFVAAARRRLATYALAYLTPLFIVGAACLVSGPQTWMYHWFAFGVFGLALALAVVCFVLGDDRMPGATFVVAGVLSMAVPFLPVAVTLAGVLFLWLMHRASKVERYAVFLL